MDDRTLKALKASIVHWEFNVEQAELGGDPDITITSCALCNLFFDDDCNGCPVKSATGYRHCVNTPYQDVATV